jgi:hypothetical protein
LELGRGDRKEAYDSIPNTVVFYEPVKVARTESHSHQIEYAFVISHSGYNSAPDCHRTWEALCLGCIPIVKSSGLDPLFEDLPVLLVKQWSDITQELLDSTILSFKSKTFQYEKLELHYWTTLMRSQKWRPRVLLTTIAIGEKYLKEYMALFHESQRKYALKCGYDFKIVTEVLDRERPDPSLIALSKLLICSQEWAQTYDFVIFIDADILINNDSPPLHDYIDYEGKIGIADEYSQPTKERRLLIQSRCGWERSATEYYKLCDFHIQTDMVFNTGVYVMQPKLHGAILQQIYNKYASKQIGHPRGFHYEQSCVGYELQKANIFKVIDNRFNAVWGLTKIDNITNLTVQDFFRCNYFTHLAGRIDYDLIPKIITTDKLTAITVSTNYDDLLSIVLPQNHKFF